MNEGDTNELLHLAHFYFDQRIDSEGLRQVDMLLANFAAVGQIEQIEMTLHELIQAYPSIIPLRLRLGLLLARVWRFDDALAELERAFEVASEADDKAAAQHILKTIMQVRVDRGNSRKQ